MFFWFVAGVRENKLTQPVMCVAIIVFTRLIWTLDSNEWNQRIQATSKRQSVSLQTTAVPKINAVQYQLRENRPAIRYYVFLETTLPAASLSYFCMMFSKLVKYTELGRKSFLLNNLCKFSPGASPLFCLTLYDLAAIWAPTFPLTASALAVVLEARTW